MIGETVRNPEIKQAVFTIKKLTKTEEMQLEALNREKAERDRISIDAEIRAEGRAEERARLAANLRAMGIPEEQIKLAFGDSILASAGEDDSEEFEP